MIDAVDHPANAPGGLIVVEVAAFMLENCTSFAADAGIPHQRHAPTTSIASAPSSATPR
jgi:hypothetical protein